MPFSICWQIRISYLSRHTIKKDAGKSFVVSEIVDAEDKAVAESAVNASF